MRDASAQRALAWLRAQQNSDGGWGGDGTSSSVEETALATEALLADVGSTKKEADEMAWKGVNWLISAVLADEHRRASPIGLYFAKLWYYESLYPLVFTVSALQAAKSSCLPTDDRSGARRTNREQAKV